MNTSYFYHALGLKDYECNKTEYKGYEIIHHLRKRADKMFIPTRILREEKQRRI